MGLLAKLQASEKSNQYLQQACQAVDVVQPELKALQRQHESDYAKIRELEAERRVLHGTIFGLQYPQGLGSDEFDLGTDGILGSPSKN